MKKLVMLCLFAFLLTGCPEPQRIATLADARIASADLDALQQLAESIVQQATLAQMMGRRLSDETVTLLNDHGLLYNAHVAAAKLSLAQGDKAGYRFHIEQARVTIAEAKKVLDLALKGF